MRSEAVNVHLPALARRVAARAGLPPPLDAFGALGGRESQPWPESPGCTPDTRGPNGWRCRLFCDEQSCDPCHPNDHGYAALAAAVHAGLGDVVYAANQLGEGEADGLVKTYDDHEQSVFSAAWSAADAWIFASLSVDGKVVINHVPPAEKYKILL